MPDPDRDEILDPKLGPAERERAARDGHRWSRPARSAARFPRQAGQAAAWPVLPAPSACGLLIGAYGGSGFALLLARRARAGRGRAPGAGYAAPSSFARTFRSERERIC